MTKPLNTFKEYYQNLNSHDKKAFALDIMALCGISGATLYRRISIPELWSPLEKKTICAMVGKTELELFGPEVEPQKIEI